MIREKHTSSREPREDQINSDLVVVGGGMSGVCAAVTAAREGLKVTLVQDRPVLGGNASSEVRLWILGATSHMGNNNRWAREGGVIDEILVENTFRNREGNNLILDTILLEIVHEEPNITLLLNTSIYEVAKKSDSEIEDVVGFCSQNSTRYVLSAPLFCDASGDGIVAFMAGASFRMGAEKQEEFGEGFAPDVEDYGELLGHSIYFYVKDVGKPVKFVAPSYAIKDAGKLARMRNYKLQDFGPWLWWVEYGGRLDTVHQSEEIKWELWKVVYGIWDYVKNSGDFPDAANLTLEWVGTIPGKRESRRFDGDYMLIQQDIVEQREHYDAVARGGWSVDLHPADGVYSDKNSCNQWHSKGSYQIPYRCFYSKDINNLFLAGRIISASHVAFGSSRVMATCAHGAQAVGIAAALAIKNNWSPRDIADPARVQVLQRQLNIRGQGIPLVAYHDRENIMNEAEVRADSELVLTALPSDGPWMPLDYPMAQMLPLKKEIKYKFSFPIRSAKETKIVLQLRASSKVFNCTPDIIIETQEIDVHEGEQQVEVEFKSGLAHDQYGFVCLMANECLEVRGSQTRITGTLSVFNKFNKAVSNFGKQEPPEGIGMESFEFWCPIRRPDGHNIAIQIEPGIKDFAPSNLKNGIMRPEIRSNAYVADLAAQQSLIEISWSQPQSIREIVLFFDTDYDHPLESTLLGHPEHSMPFCVQNYEVTDGRGKVLFSVKDNHQTINRLIAEQPIATDEIKVVLQKPNDNVPIALFEIVCLS